MEITRLGSLDDLDKERFTALVEDALDGKLHEDYFNMSRASEIYLAVNDKGEYIGALVLEKAAVVNALEKAANAPEEIGELWYMDKFVVAKKEQKDGVGRKLMKNAGIEKRKTGWRSRQNNPFNIKYDEIADGRAQLPHGMTFYHKNLTETERIIMMNYAREKPITILRPS